jgi:hypothetical protein
MSFSAKEMLAGVGLVAIGLQLVIISIGPIFAMHEGWSAGVPIVLRCIGAMYLGAGVFALVRRMWIGACIGLAVLCVVS